jgi:hypothetical protein
MEDKNVLINQPTFFKRNRSLIIWLLGANLPNLALGITGYILGNSDEAYMIKDNLSIFVVIWSLLMAGACIGLGFSGKVRISICVFFTVLVTFLFAAFSLTVFDIPY